RTARNAHRSARDFEHAAWAVGWRTAGRARRRGAGIRDVAFETGRAQRIGAPEGAGPSADANLPPLVVKTHDVVIEEVPAQHSIEVRGQFQRLRPDFQRAQVLARDGKHLRLIERWTVRTVSHRRESQLLDQRFRKRGIRARSPKQPYTPRRRIETADGKLLLP